MKRFCLLVMVLLLGSCIAFGATIIADFNNYNNFPVNANQLGTSNGLPTGGTITPMTFGFAPFLTVTAATSQTLTGNPLTGGTPAEVFWGNLTGQNWNSLAPGTCTGGFTAGGNNACDGLGVLEHPLLEEDPRNPAIGRPAVSEALIFTFGYPLGVTHVKLELIQVQATEQAQLFFHFFDNTVNQTPIATLSPVLTPLGQGTRYDFDFDTLAPGQTFGAFAIESELGAFGVAKLEYSTVPVPEPISLTLMGSGLLGLAAWRRKRT